MRELDEELHDSRLGVADATSALRREEAAASRRAATLLATESSELENARRAVAQTQPMTCTAALEPCSREAIIKISLNSQKNC